MKFQKPSLATLIISGSIVLLVIIALLIINGIKNRDVYEPDLLDIADSENAQTQTPQAVDEKMPDEVVMTFMTDSEERYVLWQKEQSMIYVHNHHLYYTEDGANQNTLHEWTEALPAEAWLSGDYLLIGTQLIPMDSPLEGHHGTWMVVHIGPTPTVINQDNMFFGPQEVLTVKVTGEKFDKSIPLFFVTTRNASNFSEYVFDPFINQWLSVNMDLIDDVPMTMPAEMRGLSYFNDIQVFNLPEGPVVYSFVDEGDSIVYYQEPYPMVWRYVGYELSDAKLLSFLDGTQSIMGRFRNEAGIEFMSLPGFGMSSLLPVEQRLWEDDWQALNHHIFTKVSPEMLEVMKYNEGASLTNNMPTFTQFLTKGATWQSSKGSLLQYENDGKIRGNTKYISWFDLINTEGGQPETLWASALQDYTIIEEHRTYETYDMLKHIVPEFHYNEINANASVPDKLIEASREKYQGGDYEYARTYRNIGAQWFVLINHELNEYVDGKLVAIGEVPISVLTRTGEGFAGMGARDFTRLDDAWFIADTEGSRVLKLNDKLEVVAEFAVHHPYQLKVVEDQLHIASTVQNLIVDKDLKLVGTVSIPFESTAHMRQVEFEYYYPHELYVDPGSGLTWYHHHDGFLYQYHELKQEYRSYYVGFSENAIAHLRIIPYKDEVFVLLDRRLERFDRQGNWLGALSFPRSKPDGIYDRTPKGENSLIVDEASELIYLVQGYRILAIDLLRNDIKTLFHQNHSDIGKLIEFSGHLYFMLHSNEEDRWHLVERQITDEGMYTEIVKIEPKTRSINRFVVEGYYHDLEINSESNERPAFVLRKYK